MPVITQLKPLRRNEWLRIDADNGESLKLPVSAVPYELHEGRDVADDKWQQLCSESAFHALYESAVRILGRRDHFEGELELKLRQRSFKLGASRDHVASVLSKCRELGYLNEERAAEQLAAELARRGGFGLRKLRHELMRRKCPPELAEKTMNNFRGESDSNTEVERALDKKRRSFAASFARHHEKTLNKAKSVYEKKNARREAEHKVSAQVVRYLVGRGFAAGHAGKVAREFVSGLE